MFFQSQKALNDSYLTIRWRKHTDIFQLHRLKTNKQKKLPVTLGVFNLGGKTKWYPQWTECSHRNTWQQTGKVASHYTNSAACWPIGLHTEVSSGWSKHEPLLWPGQELCRAFLFHHFKTTKQARRHIWKRVPPVLPDSDGLGWLVAMVTLPRHSGGPPERTGTAEKGSVSPLVLFAGLAGDGEEGAHRELRVRVCGWREKAREPGRCARSGTYPAQEDAAAPMIVSCARVPP